MIKRIRLAYANWKVETYSRRFDQAVLADTRSTYQVLYIKWLKIRDDLLEKK